MRTKETLDQELRQEKQRLDELAKAGLDQPEVIEQSRKVDRLLEEFYSQIEQNQDSLKRE